LLRLKLIFSFGNLEIIEFLKSRIDLSELPRDNLHYLGYRMDDNVEIVDAVLSKLNENVTVKYQQIASSCLVMNNINIFKYIYDISQKNSHHLIISNLNWHESNTEFLEFFLSKSLLSEKDIVDKVKDLNKDKINIILSYVDSGCLKLSSKTVELLSDSIDKN
jgi:hypothetical protein